MRTSKPKTPALLFGDGVMHGPVVYLAGTRRIFNRYGTGPHQPETDASWPD